MLHPAISSSWDNFRLSSVNLTLYQKNIFPLRSFTLSELARTKRQFITYAKERAIQVTPHSILLPFIPFSFFLSSQVRGVCHIVYFSCFLFDVSFVFYLLILVFFFPFVFFSCVFCYLSSVCVLWPVVSSVLCLLLLSCVFRPVSSVLRLLSVVFSPVFSVLFHLSSVFCLLSSVFCLLSSVFCPLFPDCCLLSSVFFLRNLYFLFCFRTFQSYPQCLCSTWDQI